MQSYFEDIKKTMEIFKEDMWIFKSQLTSSVQDVNDLLRKYTTKMELGGNFIMLVYGSMYTHEENRKQYKKQHNLRFENASGTFTQTLGYLFRDNFLVVSIYFSQLSIDNIREYAAYTWEDLFGEYLVNSLL